jgi:hypothetical protein
VDLTLHAVSASGRVALGDFLKGVKYVKVEKAGDGIVYLTPVNIKAASGQSVDPIVEPVADATHIDTPDGEIPWGQ